MDTTGGDALSQTKLFLQSLPQLLTTLRGRWVIFKGGAVEADFVTEAEAYAEAMARFGLSGDYIVIKVEETPPAEITSARIFRVA